MRAVLFDGQLRYTDDAVLRPGKPGEIAVDVLKAGICETDMQLCRGYMGFQGILGHEFVGVARTGRFAGQRVVGEINCSCRICEMCRRQLGNHCPNRTVVGILNHDGAFADTVWIPEVNLHPVPDSLSTDEAVFVEPVAAACRIPEQIPDIAGKKVVVLGDGRLGNLCAQVLKHHGAQVTVVGKHVAKLDIIAQLRIPTIALENFHPEKTADVVVDCTGSPEGLESALRTVRPCGKIVLKTTVASAQSLHMAPIVIDEIELIGSRCGPFAEALRVLAAGSVQVLPLLSATYRIEDAAEAFQQATRRDRLKILLEVTP